MVTVADQLWYTWSDVGLDPIWAGFRIRAASDGLLNIKSEHVRRLDRYLRYVLPRDADRIESLGIAPVCLALINIGGGERILVHKAYTGQDGVGRYGAFFVHLLDLAHTSTEEFSPRDAISLWSNKFWQTSDHELREKNPRGTYLSPEPVDGLKGRFDRKTLGKKLNVKRLQAFLPFVIEAYLTKISKQEKLYIAGSDEDVAQLILALTYCLPSALLHGLTFSTYEPDPLAAPTEIVGTCWLSGKDQDPITQMLLPPHFYQEKLAINCYSPQGYHTPLQKNHPLIRYDRRASEFALYATQHMLDAFMEQGKLHEILKRAGRWGSHLDVERFLQIVNDVLHGTDFTRETVERLLSPRFPADYEEAADKLALPTCQDVLFDLVLTVKGWWAKWYPKFIHLRSYSMNHPPSSLAATLSQLARASLPFAIDAWKKIMQAVAAGKTASDAENTFSTIIDYQTGFVTCTAPPQQDQEVWCNLLEELLKIANSVGCLHVRWPLYTSLMHSWAQALTPSKANNKLIEPMLAISWNRFAELLLLDLPLDWTEIATKGLLFAADGSSNSLNIGQGQEVAVLKPLLQHLAQEKEYTVLKQFLQRLAQEQARWPSALALFNMLAKGIPGPNNTLFIFDKKIDLFRSLLDSPMGGSEGLSGLLAAAGLVGEEIGQFLLQYGPRYISQHPESSTLLDLFKIYVSSGGKDRLAILSIWLQCPLRLEKLEEVTGCARLNPDERRWFLYNYGAGYRSFYPQSRLLKDYACEFLDYLRSADLVIFKNPPSPESNQPEHYLYFLNVYCRDLFASYPLSEWYATVRFVRSPTLLILQLQGIVSGIGKLLNIWVEQPERTPYILQPTRSQILKELAKASIIDESQLIPVVTALHAVLEAEDLVDLFDGIAEYASKSPSRTLDIACIHLIIHMKSAFSEGQDQWCFITRFLDALLQNANKSLIDWLNNQSKSWSSEVTSEWKRYLSQRREVSSVRPSLLTRFDLWRERLVAFWWVRWASGESAEKCLQVYMDHMTTLKGSVKKVPVHFPILVQQQWQKRQFGQIKALNSPPEQQPGTPQKPANQLAKTLERRQFRWKRRIAFFKVRRALKSQRIGRIVRARAEHMNILNRFGNELSNEEKLVIDAAWEFFIAYGNADDVNPDEAKEQTIVNAYESIEDLADKGFYAPIFTAHEEQRIERAIQFIDDLEEQDRGRAEREQLIKALRASTPITNQQTISLQPGREQKLARWDIRRLFRRSNGS